MLCFNGPFSQGLIEEIGSALRRYMESETVSSSSARDVFAVYIEITQNIQHYCKSHDYNDAEASATVVIGRDSDGHYVISAGQRHRKRRCRRRYRKGQSARNAR